MNRLRINIRPLFAIAGLMLLSQTGCKYNGSFMNMDSNSGSPFFGLQLAVDSGSRPPKPGDAEKLIRMNRDHLLPRQRSPGIPDRDQSDSTTEPIFLFRRSAALKRNGFETTSESRDLNTNIRYSLQSPTSDASLRTESIDLRLSAF
ncbi:MAG: hypothetical protein O2856_09435 [Planctomycetota bacterium]|nr:hypothetical protein [Planctomycetota bacterium]